MSAKDIPRFNKADYLKILAEGELTITGQFMQVVGLGATENVMG